MIFNFSAVRNEMDFTMKTILYIDENPISFRRSFVSGKENTFSVMGPDNTDVVFKYSNQPL